MNEFPGPEQRIRRVLTSAITGECTYLSSGPEGDSRFTLRVQRDDGRIAGVRFFGLREPGSAQGPETGTPLRIKRVGSVSSLVRWVPLLRLIQPPGPPYARVTIEAGPATLEIVCQDAEWWEE